MDIERKRRARILVVDDEPLVLDIFASVLAEDDFDVDEAGSAMDALLRLEQQSYDLLLCDVRLDPFNGFDIAEIARKRNPNIGVLLVTGAPLASDGPRAEQVSAAYLVKPVGIDQLRLAVKQLLGVKSRESVQLMPFNCSLGVAYPLGPLRPR